MDLFSDFSFETATHSRRFTPYNDLDMDDISPSSSRSASPSATTLPSPTTFARRVSMAELADTLHSQHLDGPSPTPLFGRLQNPSLRKASGASPLIADAYDTVRRRRASGARHLCSAARLASIETLVDRMMKDGSSCYASLHPSAGGGSAGRRQLHHARRSEITSAPTSMPTTPGLGSETASSDEDSEIEDGEDLQMAKVRSVGGPGGVAAAKRRAGVQKSRKKMSPPRR